MFGLVNNKKDYPELGGEIHQDKKRRERNILIIFGVVAVILVNLILYFMTQAWKKGWILIFCSYLSYSWTDIAIVGKALNCFQPDVNLLCLCFFQSYSQNIAGYSPVHIFHFLCFNGIVPVRQIRDAKMICPRWVSFLRTRRGGGGVFPLTESEKFRQFQNQPPPSGLSGTKSMKNEIRTEAFFLSSIFKIRLYHWK